MIFNVPAIFADTVIAACEVPPIVTPALIITRLGTVDVQLEPNTVAKSTCVVSLECVWIISFTAE